MSLNNLTYQRLKTAQGLKQNRLYHVNDAIDAQAFEDDIDDQGAFNGDASTINTANNYAYDELGNLTRNTQKEIAEIKWTVYGKVQQVSRPQGSSKKNLKFEYNATGQRIAKHVYSSYWKPEYTDYYVYDAQGNIMSIYRLSVDEQQQTASYTLTERPIYGSGRLGVDKATLEFMGYTPPTNNLTNHVLGLKQYEGSNHLGNILTTFSDKKIPVDSDNDGVIDYSTADITSSTDYYPFGVTMKGRDFTSNVSRFGFNGKEKDEETETMDFGARLLDGDLGVWLALDPLMGMYAGLSPYNYCSNNPIFFVDPDGKKIIPAGRKEARLLKSMIENYFGENSGFIVKRGEVKLNKRDFENFIESCTDPNMIENAYRLKEVVNNKEYYTVVKVSTSYEINNTYSHTTIQTKTISTPYGKQTLFEKSIEEIKLNPIIAALDNSESGKFVYQLAGSSPNSLKMQKNSVVLINPDQGIPLNAEPTILSNLNVNSVLKNLNIFDNPFSSKVNSSSESTAFHEIVGEAYGAYTGDFSKSKGSPKDRGLKQENDFNSKTNKRNRDASDH